MKNIKLTKLVATRNVIPKKKGAVCIDIKPSTIQYYLLCEDGDNKEHKINISKKEYKKLVVFLT